MEILYVPREGPVEQNIRRLPGISSYNTGAESILRSYLHGIVYTSSGGEDTMVNGEPSAPRLVTAVDPRTSDTYTTMVTLKPFSVSPGESRVFRTLDADAEADSMLTVTALSDF